MASSESRIVWITLSGVFLSIRSENEERESLREGFRLPTGRITGEKIGIIGDLGDDFEGRSHHATWRMCGRCCAHNLLRRLGL